MTTKNAKFMDLYRRLETAVKAKGYNSVKEYEESIINDQPKQGKMKICRTIRNYIEHENSAFVEASDNMIAFIEKEVGELDAKFLPVKKKMISIKYAIHESDLIVIAADFITKRKLSIIPVFDNNDFATGVISMSDVVKCVASGAFSKAKKVSMIQNTHKFGFLKEDTPMSEVMPLLENQNKIYLVLNDNKKVVGWIS